MPALYLTWAENEVPEEGFVVVRQHSLTLSWNKDAAGQPFHDFALRQRGLLKDMDEESDAGSSEESAETGANGSSRVDLSSLEREAQQAADGGSKKKKKKGKGGRRDLYALLGLQDERWLATDSSIRSAYKRTALAYHPDKLAATHKTEASRHKAEEQFKAIQAAYETLTDSAKRREFDATDEFDDSAPDASEVPAEDFFKVFGSVFERNARWSTKSPVPSLGDDEAPDTEVDAFYKFWFAFKSWRDFPHEDEEDVEGAEGREHKRWIERQNAKLREAGRKQEVRRIRALVEDVERHDPRLVRRREARRLEREAKTAEREAAAKKAAEDKAAAEAAEAIAREAAANDAAAAKKRWANERKALQKERSRLRKFASSVLQAALEHGVDADDAREDAVDEIAAALPLNRLRAACKELEALAPECEESPEALRHALAALAAARGVAGEETEAEAAARAASAREALEKAKARAEADAEQRRASLASWSDEEVRLLQRALAKFPVGTARRWEAVQAAVRTRTVDEIVQMVKHGLKSASLAKAGAATGAYVAPPSAKIASAADTRDAAFTDVQVVAGGVAKGDAEGGDAPAPIPSPTPVVPTPKGVWTEEQERALILALKAVPKGGSDRWGAVAGRVPGKGKADCMAKFKAMKLAHKSGKQDAA